jgi:hypothetical protein
MEADNEPGTFSREETKRRSKRRLAIGRDEPAIRSAN